MTNPYFTNLRSSQFSPQKAIVLLVNQLSHYPLEQKVLKRLKDFFTSHYDPLLQLKFNFSFKIHLTSTYLIHLLLGPLLIQLLKISVETSVVLVSLIGFWLDSVSMVLEQ